MHWSVKSIGHVFLSFMGNLHKTIYIWIRWMNRFIHVGWRHKKYIENGSSTLTWTLVFLRNRSPSSEVEDCQSAFSCLPVMTDNCFSEVHVFEIKTLSVDWSDINTTVVTRSYVITTYRRWDDKTSYLKKKVKCSGEHKNIHCCQYKITGHVSYKVQ